MFTASNGQHVQPRLLSPHLYITNEKTEHLVHNITAQLLPPPRLLFFAFEQLKSRAKTFERISWKTSSAFVVFNHETSVTRCLADYARYPLWMQPSKLRFRQTHKILVRRVSFVARRIVKKMKSIHRVLLLRKLNINNYLYF